MICVERSISIDIVVNGAIYLQYQQIIVFLAYLPLPAAHCRDEALLEMASFGWM